MSRNLQQAAAGVHLNYEYALALSYNAFSRGIHHRGSGTQANGDGSNGEQGKTSTNRLARLLVRA